MQFRLEGKHFILYKGFLKKKKEKMFESREDMAVGAVISMAESVTSWTSLAGVALVSFTSWASPFSFSSLVKSQPAWLCSGKLEFEAGKNSTSVLILIVASTTM